MTLNLEAFVSSQIWHRDVFYQSVFVLKHFIPIKNFKGLIKYKDPKFQPFLVNEIIEAN